MQPFDNGALGEVTRLAVFASAGLAVVVVGARPLRTLEMMKAMHLRAVFIVPLASMVWSVNRSSTETALLSFVGASAIAILIIQELTNERAIAAVIVATGAALLLSIAAELFFVPLRAGASFGVSGIFEHKNALGRAAILLSMAALVAWSMRGRSRLWTTAALLGLAALLSIWTGSGTSTVTVGITIASFLAMSIGRIGPFRDVRIRHMSVIFVLFAMLTSAIIVGPTNLIESVLAVLGRESDNNTLFVRLSLWKATLNEIVDKPLLGFGYGTFNFETVTVSTGSRTVVWEAQQPHNGALHVAYQLGLLGVLVYARHLVALWRSASVSIRRSVLGPYLLIVGLANITYSMFYGTLAVFWIVHIIVAWAVVERTRIHHDNGVPS
ncbi:MAG: hypothetical protein R8J94_00730 [Acidimicrobiia bacterium]|nr:hypothetical protein [Acidimicrobiia bacterium]